MALTVKELKMLYMYLVLEHDVDVLSTKPTCAWKFHLLEYNIITLLTSNLLSVHAGLTSQSVPGKLY